MTNRYVVGTESAKIVLATDADISVRTPEGVWHAVEPGSLDSVCGVAGVEVFEDIAWEARRTAVLCFRCLRAAAGWSASGA